MYICVCNAIRECELREAARRCPGDVDAVYEALGCRPQCGQCLDDAAEMLIEERTQMQAEGQASGLETA
ncbi:MAG: bacterioferritin-associated ferredoxin [Novosphingobium sp.]|jgi:bacterioferritin-associated ferredoxin|nr:(2Fe-2S)-binding protein [Novosphingobium sp.]